MLISDLQIPENAKRSLGRLGHRTLADLANTTRMHVERASMVDRWYGFIGVETLDHVEAEMARFGVRFQEEG